MMNKVPVTILTGHLGAGKTTLLRRLLTNKLGKRIAVIENEFGNEVGIERLLAGVSLDEGSVFRSEDLFVELTNGCVCCSVKDTLVSTLETLLQRSRQKIDHIVVETTGVADPGPLAGIFWLDDELESELALDGVVTVVDLTNIEARLDSAANEAMLQLAYADRIVLNKRDLLTEEQCSRVLSRVRQINPSALCQEASFGDVDLTFCLEVNAFDSSRLRQLGLEENDGDRIEVVHDTSVKSIVLRRENKPVLMEQLRNMVAELLWEPPEGFEIFRIKGVVWSKQTPEQVHVIQGVHKTFEIQDLDGVQWSHVDVARPITKIVVIGRIPDREYLIRRFEQLSA